MYHMTRLYLERGGGGSELKKAYEKWDIWVKPKTEWNIWIKHKPE
jgi:hypothetical protein